MSEQQTEKYQNIRRLLEEQKRKILDGSGGIVGSNLNPNADHFPDLGDQASAETGQNYVLRIKEREQKLLKKIDEAIERMNDGVFGICDSCGEYIEEKRLVARPVTTCCIECKTRQENDEKLRED